MTVKELIKFYFDKVIIYRPTNDDMTEFEDLYEGDKHNIPDELMLSQVCVFSAKTNNVIEISI